MLDYIIMNLFKNTTEKKDRPVKMFLKKIMRKSTCTKVLFRIIHGRKILKIPKNVKFTSLCLQKNLFNYMDGLLYIIIEEEEIKIRTNQWFNHSRDFNNKHVITPYNVTISNIPKEEQFITCMTPTGFINGQD